MREFLFLILNFNFISCITYAQDVTMSPPVKVNTGESRVEIIGRTDQGILVRHTQRSDDELVTFYDNMQQHWRKKIPVHDKDAVVQQIVAYPDSMTFLYTVSNKGETTLNAMKTDSRIDPQSRTIILDTLSRNFLAPASQPAFAFTPDKELVLYWFNDPNFESSHVLHTTCMSGKLKVEWRCPVKISGFDHPDVITGVVDTSGDAVIICGNYKERSFSNDFPYTEMMVISIRDHGKEVHSQIIRDGDVLFSDCLAKPDAFTGNVVIGGLYSHAAGNESSGFYLLKYSAADDSVTSTVYQAHTTDFLSQLTGSVTPKRNDGFFDFHPVELIVKRDGGAVLLAEAQSVSSESFTSPGLGTFGLSSGFTVNSYHYDDIAVSSFKPNGDADWKLILHKKQATEGDGGFYSSFAMVIAKQKAYIMYNDETNGQTSVECYVVDAAGNQTRTELFNADRKGVMPTMKLAKQISANEILIPSFKRSFLQFIKITF